MRSLPAMRRAPVRLVLVLVCAVSALALPGTVSAADVAGGPQVPSLEPERAPAATPTAPPTG